MILDGIILLAGSILWVILKLFTLITFALPQEILNAIGYFLSYFSYVRGLIDVDTLFKVAGIYALWTSLLYSFKIIKWAYAHIPWFGKHAPLPHSEHTRIKN